MPKKTKPNSNQPAVIDTPVDNKTLKSEKFPLSEAIKLRIENRLTFKEIADRYGVSKQAVHSKLRKFIRILGEPDINNAYKEQRKQILSATERVLIESMLDPTKLKNASLNNIAYSFQQIHTARRLEEGHSTQNIGVHALLVEQACAKE